MNYSTYRFTLDIHQTRSQVSIPVLYQDTWVKFLIDLTDGGKPYTLEGVEKVILYAKKKDGTTLTEECDIIDNYTRIEYPFSEQTASAIGPVECEFRLYSKEGGKHITTPSFIILVEERVVEDEDLIPSISNPSAIDRMIETEAARVEAETERLANEASRVSAEAERVKAETARVEAESKRQNLADTIDAKIAGKVDKYEGQYSRIYGTANGGKQMMYDVSSGSGQYTIAYRGADGVLGVGTAKDPTHAVPFAQMQEHLAEKADTATLDTLVKKVENLEAGVAPDMFTTDSTTAHVKPIPADAAPYAELRAVGGMIHTHQLPPPNLFKASVLDAENNRTYYDENLGVEPIIYANNGVYTIDQANYTYGSVSYVTAATVRELFPNAVAGKKYTFSYDAEGESGTGIYFTGGAGGSTFTMTETILDGHLEMNGAETFDGSMYWPASATYSNITLTEVGGGERYLTEAKVTALDIYGKNLYNGGFGGNACATEVDGVLTMTRTAEDRWTNWWYPPFPMTEVSVRAEVLTSSLTTDFTAQCMYENGEYGDAWFHPSVGVVSKGINPRSDGARITRLRIYLQNAEAAGVSIKMKDFMILPTATPTDTTYSPYHKHTFAIPAEVQALDGYGWGAISGHNGEKIARNDIEWDENGRPCFVKRVERVVYNGTESWVKSSYQNAVMYKRYFAGFARNGVCMSNRFAYGTPAKTGVPCMHEMPTDIGFYPDNPPDTVEGWKAQLAQWAAEGDPLTVYYELETPIVTDISHLITDDNLIPVEGGGVIVAVNENEEAAPSTIIYQKRGV